MTKKGPKVSRSASNNQRMEAFTAGDTNEFQNRSLYTVFFDHRILRVSNVDQCFLERPHRGPLQSFREPHNNGGEKFVGICFRAVFCFVLCLRACLLAEVCPFFSKFFIHGWILIMLYSNSDSNTSLLFIYSNNYFCCAKAN